MRVIDVQGEAAQRRLGGALADVAGGGFVVFLRGDLGAGKSTLVRGALRRLGYSGVVPSPTYPLLECYELNKGRLCHFDLYRLGDPEELEFIGARDVFDTRTSCWIEWPERAAGVLPQPDLDIHITGAHEGRRVALIPHSPRGKTALEGIRWSG
ncbi:MAG: tRNA (adenosine(37)-N6)-threonylcarbamoyltransferase complex ATPase subunit type 1 TsaE [Gammaproteobacteria bacterium]|nr:tRNA (adenosine(37)-N6)-threonylcarbamoyltransferase complex ATPase subunit type 1 TsaE [Gammaproteobacteria bacterium]